MYYFAYGSNLNQDDLASHFRQYGVHADMIQPLSVGYLPDWSLTFDRRSTSRNGGVLNLKAARGYVVEGVVFKITAEAQKVLDAKEGCPTAYDRCLQQVCQSDGTWLEAWVYHANKKSAHFEAPSAEYVEIVRAGLQSYGLSADSLMAAANNQTPARVEKFFVYGSLMAGECNHRQLQAFGIRRITAATCPGQLYSTTSYFPGLTVDDEKGKALVHGQVIEVEDGATAIAVLDRFEGFSGYGKAGNLFERRPMVVSTEAGRRELAWAYVLADETMRSAPVTSGRWCGQASRLAGPEPACESVCDEEDAVKRDFDKAGFLAEVEGLEEHIRAGHIGYFAQERGTGISWSGADLVISSQPLPDADDCHQLVVTPHSTAVAWALNEARDRAFRANMLDYQSKYEFFWRLGNIVATSPSESTEVTILLHMCQELKAMAHDTKLAMRGVRAYRYSSVHRRDDSFNTP